MQRSTQRLLGELDVLPYQERMSTLARRARDLAATDELPAVLADLGGGSPYHRFLAVAAGEVLGDQAAVRAALNDPHRSIRAVAVKAGLRAGWLAGDELLAFVRDAPADLRRLVYRSLRHLRRSTVADGLVDAVLARFGAVEAIALLPACGAETVGRLLPDVEHAVENAVPLARRQADVLLTLPRCCRVSIGCSGVGGGRRASEASWWPAAADPTACWRCSNATARTTAFRATWPTTARSSPRRRSGCWDC